MRIALIEDSETYKYELRKIMCKYGIVDNFECHVDFLKSLPRLKIKYDLVICDRYTGSDALDFCDSGKNLAPIIRENNDGAPIFIVLISASFFDGFDTTGFDLVLKKNKMGFHDLEELLKNWVEKK